MDNTRYAARREHLRALMRREGLDALIVSHPANRFYLSGFELHDSQCNESSGCLIIRQNGRDWLCTDSRYEEAAAELWDRDRIFIYRGSAAEEIRTLLRERVSCRIGFESAIVSHNFVTRLEPGLSLEAADGLVEELRVIKDDEEIRLMEKSARLNHQLMEWLPSILTAGNTEAGIAWSIEKFFREHGATENSFSPIVAKDAHAALPHYNPFEEAHGPTEITPNCHILVDVGARLGHYCSDQTRTFWVGDKPEKRFLDMLDAVREAQREAMAPARVAEEGDPNMTEKVKIRLPVNRENPGDNEVVVGLNGCFYKIRRGVTVEVPRAVALILQQSEEQDASTLEMIEAIRDGKQHQG